MNASVRALVHLLIMALRHACPRSRKRKGIGSRLRIFLCCILACLSSQFPSPALSQDGELDDARRILAGEAGVVKRWRYPPEIAVLHTGEFDLAHLRKTIEFLNSHAGLGIDTNARQRNLSSMEGSLFGETRLEYRRSRGDKSTIARVLFPDGETMSASIFVYKLDIASSSLFLVLSRAAKGAWSLSRQFAEGGTPCFFYAMSLRNEMRIAHIFIRDDLSGEEERACIYEELVQTMGLLHDAPGSAYFTFDNMVAPKPDPLDWKLLAALYADDIAPGAEVEKVLRKYVEID